MADWQSRLLEAAYTAPSGTRRTFLYEDVSRVIPLRSQAFGFPGVDGSYVQQNGRDSDKYPLRCIFSGPSHDLEAKLFEDMLVEPGRGKLEHPVYGTKRVVPFGEITRRDDLKTSANQTIIEVEFWTQLAEIYPSAAVDPENQIVSALDASTLAAAEQYAALTDLTKQAQKAAAKGTIRGMLDSVSATIREVSDLVTSVRSDFQDGVDLINYGMDVLIGQPLLLAQQIKDLILAPSRALDGLRSRLDMYEALADRIFGSDAGLPASAVSHVSAASGGRFSLSERSQRIANDFHAADLFASSALAGAAASVLASTNADARAAQTLESGSSGLVGPRGRQFRTRPDALRSADRLGTLLDTCTTWRDTGFAALAALPKTGPYQQDPGEAHAQLRTAILLAQGHLVELSFSLVPERAVVLDRPRTIVDLSAELYGHVDPRDGFDPLDFMIEANGLAGEEILEIPRGRKIVYYDYAA